MNLTFFYILIRCSDPNDIEKNLDNEHGNVCSEKSSLSVFNDCDSLSLISIYHQNLKKIKSEYLSEIFHFSDELYYKIFLCRTSNLVNFESEEIFELISFGLPILENNSNMLESILIDFLKTDLYNDIILIYFKQVFEIISIFGLKKYICELDQIINDSDQNKMFDFFNNTLPIILMKLKNESKINTLSSENRCKFLKISSFLESLSIFFNFCDEKLYIFLFRDKSIPLFQLSDQQIDNPKKEILINIMDCTDFRVFNYFSNKKAFFFRPKNQPQKNLISYIIELPCIIFDLHRSLLIEYIEKGCLKPKYIEELVDFITKSIYRENIVIECGSCLKSYLKDKQTIESNKNTILNLGSFFSRFLLKKSYLESNNFNISSTIQTTFFQNYQKIYDLLDPSESAENIIIKKSSFENSSFVSLNVILEKTVKELQMNLVKYQKKDFLIFEVYKSSIMLCEGDLMKVFDFFDHIIIVSDYYYDNSIYFLNKPMFGIIWSEFYYFHIANTDRSFYFPNDLDLYRDFEIKKIEHNIIIETIAEIHIILGNFLILKRLSEIYMLNKTKIKLFNETNKLIVEYTSCEFITIFKISFDMEFHDCEIFGTIESESINIIDESHISNKLIFCGCTLIPNFIFAVKNLRLSFKKCTFKSTIFFKEIFDFSEITLVNCTGKINYFGISAENINYRMDSSFDRSFFMKSYANFQNYKLTDRFKKTSKSYLYIHNCRLDVIFDANDCIIYIFASTGSFHIHFSKIENSFGRIYIENESFFKLDCLHDNFYFHCIFITFEKNPEEFIKKYANKNCSISGCFYKSEDGALISIPDIHI